MLGWWWRVRGGCSSGAVTLAVFTSPPGTILQRQKRLERPRLHRGSPLGVLRILLLAAQRVVDEWHAGVGRWRRFSNASLSAEQPLITSVSETRAHETLAIQCVCLKTQNVCLSGLFHRFLQPFAHS